MRPVLSKVEGQVRCAIYTRKSSDEGLEQSFNSLDAQREACGAYILSQACEGWTALPTLYDDGGLSGGTLQRPALQRLLADVQAGQVDIIVVYKVDRLTRSLFDFAKLVELLDKAGTSFVSVTQSFNTTTSMGRLTLNMLLSFAQFEREVTAERIRDKIAASKAKGMWMGGTPPLGYTPEGRTLAIVPGEAELVRHLFDRYLALGSVRLVEDELRQTGVTLPVRRRAKDGKAFGGGLFTRGQIYKILGNPIYIGRIAHGTQSYAGLQPAIVDTDRWDRAQAQLADRCQGTSRRVRARVPSLLAGRVVDHAGEPMIAVHATKANACDAAGATRYRYYVSRALHQGDATTGLRVPALELERVVIDRLVDALGDPLSLAATIGLTMTPAGLAGLTAKTEALAGELRRRDCAAVAALVASVRIDTGMITIDCHAAALADRLGLAPTIDAPRLTTITAEVTLTRTGRVVRLVHDNGTAPPGTPDRALVRLLVKARRWWSVLREGELNTSDLARREGVTPSYLARVVRLAFLAPEVTQAILAGRQHPGTTVARLTLKGDVPADWELQKSMLLTLQASEL